MIEWCFTPVLTIFQSYHGDSLHYSCLSWVSPVLGWGSEVSCPRTLPQKNVEDPVRLERRTPGLRVKHFTTEPRRTPCTLDTNCDINLRTLVTKTVNIIFDPKRYSGAQWKHPKIGGHFMAFLSGKLSVNGRVSSVSDTKRRVRRYARQLQQLGWQVQLSRIRVVTITVAFTLDSMIYLDKVCSFYSGSYKPELFPSALFKVDGIHFTCFQTGTVLMTSIKRTVQLDIVCIPIFSSPKHRVLSELL